MLPLLFEEEKCGCVHDSFSDHLDALGFQHLLKIKGEQGRIRIPGLQPFENIR